MKTKIKLFFALSATALLSLTSCGNAKYAEETDEAIINQLEVVNREDGVYGNIYLPTEVEGATVTWKSSNQKVIDAKWNGDMAPGIVHRQGQDMTVKLTAVIDKNGSTPENGTLHYYSVEDDEISITVNGTTAEMTGRSRVNAAVYGGGRHTWRLQMKSKLAKNDGRWQFVESKASTY